MGIFDFERLFDLNHDGMLDPLEKGLEFTVIEDIMNDDEDEDNDDLFSSDSDDEFDTDFDDDLFSKQFNLQAKSEMNFSIKFISLIFLFIVILFKRYSL